MTPAEADHWFQENLPGQEGWLRFDLAHAAGERVSDFADLLPAALALLSPGNPVVFPHDVGPMLAAAFPRPHRDGDQLTPAQQAYLTAIIDRDDLWNPRASRAATAFQQAGLPHDRDACRALVARADTR